MQKDSTPAVGEDASLLDRLHVDSCFKFRHIVPKLSECLLVIGGHLRPITATSERTKYYQKYAHTQEEL